MKQAATLAALILFTIAMMAASGAAHYFAIKWVMAH